MPKVQCPTFIVHGQKDALIPIEQAQQLNDACSGPSFMLSPPQMTHNDFDFYEDIIRPLMQFLVQSNILNQANFTENDSECSEEEFFDSSKLSVEQLKKDKEAEEKARFIEVSTFNEQESNRIQQAKEYRREEEKWEQKVKTRKVQFSEEYFIPPSKKENYLMQTSDTSFH
jgi:hypothetical protein